MKYAALLTCLAVLSGCATQPGFKPVPDSVPPKTKSVETLVNISQKELNADINVSNTAAVFAAAGVFGVIPALAAATVDMAVNNSRTKAAEVAVTPIRDTLVDFNANEVLRSALGKELKTVAWVGDAPVTVNTEVTMPVQEKRYADTKHDALLVVYYNYKLSPDFRSLVMTGTASLFPKATELRSIQAALYDGTTKINQADAEKTQFLNSLYTNTVTFTYALADKPDDIEAGSKVWAENNGQRARAALSTGANVIARIVASDFAAPVALTSATASKLTKKEPYQLEIDGKRYTVTQQPWGPSFVTAAQ